MFPGRMATRRFRSPGPVRRPTVRAPRPGLAVIQAALLGVLLILAGSAVLGVMDPSSGIHSWVRCSQPSTRGPR